MSMYTWDLYLRYIDNMFFDIEVSKVDVRDERKNERVCSKSWTTLLNDVADVDVAVAVGVGVGAKNELYIEVNVCLLSCESIPYMIIYIYICILYIASNLQIH
jgi:hypothetical protein